jgi:cell division protein YceG involved in septum cleavage
LTLEGFLYPDTHFALKDNFEVESYMNLLLKNFDKKIAQEYFQNLTGKQIIETINIASILEREERNLSEKATVAGILIKRYQE